MIPHYTEEEFKMSKSRGNLSLLCENCGNVFLTEKKYITNLIKNPNSIKKLKYCNMQCKGSALNKSVDLKCSNCNKVFNKKFNQIKKSNNHFCSRSCAATYNNKHKTKGYRRSKLEVYLENQLTELYPDLKIDFNKTDTIESELDIYIPSLKLAFELSGVFHYEPIYGQEKLDKIQNNDNRKFQACIERKIELCIIDTSQQKYFKEKTSQKYLDIIIKILNQKTLLNS